MVSLSTWFRYIAHKFEYSVSLGWKNYKIGQITDSEVRDTVWKNLFQGKLTYLHWNKGEEMVPTIGGQGGTLLVRKLPITDPTRVFVGDVVVLKDPEKSDNYLVRRLAAVEGYEMVSTDEKDEPFVLENDQCWVVSDNDSLKAKEAKDSRTFGPVPMTDIVGRVIYEMRTAVDHSPVKNSHWGMRKDLPVLEVELDIDEMARSARSTAIEVRSVFLVMSGGLHIVNNSIPGYGLYEAKCLPCSGVSGRATSASSYSCLGDYKYSTQYKVLRLKVSAFASKGTFFACNASSSSQRRNPDFSRQNKHGFSRGRNRQNQERENVDNVEESELLSSKNGPLLSLSSSQRFQATATPGPREKEIVELFRKVQAQLRERAAVKEEKKNEASRGQGRESDTVDSLLKLLRKHSVEQGKKNSGSKDFNLEQPEQNSLYEEEQNLSLFDSSSIAGEGESSVPPSTRPASNFQRRSPVPRLKYQPVYATKARFGLDWPSNSQGKRRKSFVEPESEPESEPEPEPEHEPEPEPENVIEPELASNLEQETVFSGGQVEVRDVMFESGPSDADEADDNEISEEPSNEHTDMSSLKVSELRSLAKSRGVKGYSKLKKDDLIELLGGVLA
ncbi:hypothetical protein NE237_014042 [Protea cynaroides]|uniref:Rho termination factor-like N-terminal domain-containing protein n=1 Tax=Protea cynaroides TaxID=273540 RepID=A0A9Q0JYI4_9MAGN|nr:hypothetical protein NE237_014042 [Protea cynaroides]